MTPERIRLLSFVGGERGYCGLLGETERTSAVLLDGAGGSEAAAGGAMSDGRVSLDSGAGSLEVSWSPAGPLLEFAIGAGIRVHAVAASAAGQGGGLSGPGVLWDLPAGGHSTLRTAWAATAKSHLTLLVAVRPEDSREHGEEVVGAARIIPGAEPYGYVEPLLSTEYDARGAHVRATLELWTSEDEGPPERGAGTRLSGSALQAGAGRFDAARFAWKLGGAQAIGAYEILHP